ncbi:hypothetical protein M885DRAFT_136756 [Pelagophyceae sp. CCMP2097]|nr:hypothetical protein M885DRAFT_136756 [Pelagophyceae sp. CCMP2097]
MLRVLAVACCAAALAPRAAPQRRHSVKLAASAEDAPSAEPVAAATAAAAAQLSAAQSAAEAAETVAAAAVVETVAAAVVETVAAAAVETAAPVPAAPKKTDYESLKSGCETYAAAEAVALGLCDEKDFVGAAKLFEHSLTLPGDGRDVVRVQNKASPVGGGPVLRGQEEVRFASPLQKQTAWFNVACCKAKVGDGDGACEALETALKLGFDDYQLIRSDSDFDDCRDEFPRQTQKGNTRMPRAPARSAVSKSRSTQEQGMCLRVAQFVQKPKGSRLRRTTRLPRVGPRPDPLKDGSAETPGKPDPRVEGRTRTRRCSYLRHLETAPRDGPSGRPPGDDTSRRAWRRPLETAL